MKKTLISIMVIAVLVCTLGVTTNAQSNASIYEIGDVVVIFDATSSFTAEEQAQLAKLIASQANNCGESETTSYGLMCTLFGHKYGDSESVTAITHKVNETHPRCLKEFYIITPCTRCDHADVERTGFYYINCCAED